MLLQHLLTQNKGTSCRAVEFKNNSDNHRQVVGAECTLGLPDVQPSEAPGAGAPGAHGCSLTSLPHEGEPVSSSVPFFHHLTCVFSMGSWLS